MQGNLYLETQIAQVSIVPFSLPMLICLPSLAGEWVLILEPLVVCVAARSGIEQQLPSLAQPR